MMITNQKQQTRNQNINLKQISKALRKKLANLMGLSSDLYE